MKTGRTIPCSACKYYKEDLGECKAGLHRFAKYGESLKGCDYGDSKIEKICRHSKKATGFFDERGVTPGEVKKHLHII